MHTISYQEVIRAGYAYHQLSRGHKNRLCIPLGLRSHKSRSCIPSVLRNHKSRSCIPSTQMEVGVFVQRILYKKFGFLNEILELKTNVQGKYKNWDRMNPNGFSQKRNTYLNVKDSWISAWTANNHFLFPICPPYVISRPLHHKQKATQVQFLSRV